MKNRDEIKKLLVMAVFAGKIMLRNGAETYRVEDTIIRICKSRSVKYAESFVTPTGIFITIEYENEIVSYIQRIKTIKIDLDKVALVNDFSRKFVESQMSLDSAFQQLKAIDKAPSYSKFTRLLFGGIAGGFFSLLFGGSILDFFATFFISMVIVGITSYLNTVNVTFFLSNIIGSIIATALSGLFEISGLNFNMDKIIIGSIMLLVPGVAITNAIRDSISGDFLSGISRSMEAVMIALAIAFGVGITLKFYLSVLGGI